MSTALLRNQQADRLHGEGLEARRAGDFSQAHFLFEQALAALTDDRDTVDGLVQSARIVRHTGYAYIRQATEESEITLLDGAHTSIRQAIELTAPLMSGLAFSGIELAPSQQKRSPKGVRREVATEHGAALSLLSSFVTVKAVMEDLDTRSDSEAAVQHRSVDQQPYGLADDILRMGNNGRFRVEHAMRGLRQECLNGQTAHMGPWLARAVRGLVWTAAWDSTNLPAARSAFARGWSHIQDYETARQSVLLDP